jgi:hypothetical protein
MTACLSPDRPLFRATTRGLVRRLILGKDAARWSLSCVIRTAGGICKARGSPFLHSVSTLSVNTHRGTSTRLPSRKITHLTVVTFESNTRLDYNKHCLPGM